MLNICVFIRSRNRCDYTSVISHLASHALNLIGDRWALTVPGHDPTRFISPSALMISMGVNLMRDCAEGREAVAGFDFGSEAFEMRLQAGRLHTVSVTRPDAPFVLSGNGNSLAMAVYGAAPLEQLNAKEVIGVDGDTAVAQDFIDLFRLTAQP
ncbi:MAG: hypothetical protein ACTHY7_01980 [Marinobacter sp.]|uniref:hypothetical protein n=1 Tax=Marinobacter sp. TaxID=50741 RepID=UPI003F997E7E